MKAFRLYPDCRAKRFINSWASLQNNFISLINEDLKKYKLKYVRIHESGDFYNQDYLNKWFTIAKMNPEKIFYCYTKTNLNFKNKPVNFKVIFSADKTTKQKHLKAIKNKRQAVMLDKNESAPQGFIKCIGDCQACSVCYTTEKNVYFNIL